MSHARDEEDQTDVEIDFAWLLVQGIQMGFSEEEIERMTFGKWIDCFEVYKRCHNMRAAGAMYKVEVAEKERKIVSATTL